MIYLLVENKTILRVSIEQPIPIGKQEVIPVFPSDWKGWRRSEIIWKDEAIQQKAVKRSHKKRFFGRNKEK